jgi:hypothetical protein
MQQFEEGRAHWGGLRQGLALLMLALLVTLVYWGGLHGPFLFDDFPALVDNARIHVKAGDWPALWRAATSFDPGGTGRQLAMASFGLNHMLGGLDPWGWKLGGLLVHLLNTMLVYLLCARVLRLAGVGAWLHPSAWAIALLWAVHPLQVSTVLYVVQRMETLSLTFVLMALLAYLRGRAMQIEGRCGWPWLLACVPLLLLALGSKETALLLPAYTLALELTLLQFGGATLGQRRFWRWGYGAGVAVAAILFACVVVPHYAAAEAYAIRDFSALERVLTQLRVLPLYLGQMVLPLPGTMTFYYDDMQASHALLSPLSTLWGGLLLLGLLLLAFLLRRRAPLFALGVLWFFAAHLITSNVIALELVFEHRNYFALLGVLLALADLVRRLPVKDGPAIKVAAIVAVVAGVGFLGAVRSAVWGEGLLLSTELAAINPQSPRAAHELGVRYYEMADGSADSPFFSFAVREFERESQLPNASVLAEQSLILMHAGRGLPVNPQWWSRLHERLRNRPITPETTGALFGLLNNRLKGVALDDAALGDAFLLMFDKVVMPPYSYVQVAAHARDYRHDPDLEMRLLAIAVEQSKGHPGYVTRMAEGLRKDGHVVQADFVLAKAKTAGMAP